MIDRRSFITLSIFLIVQIYATDISPTENGCPPMQCPTGCDSIIRDVNGCPSCQCRTRQCSRVMCRMYCLHGFKRDEDGCEICSCNDAPQACPSLNCQQTCKTYRKDYSGCPTCECECPMTDCPPTLNCTNGLKKAEDGCTICSCNESVDRKNGDKHCSLATCRMFCMYGFKHDEQGCEICECDWAPIAENIQCSERIPCPGTRVCNLNLKLCEIVDPDRVNWFVYDFGLKLNFINDAKFLETFKSGLIHNIAKKYKLRISQITISAVETNGLTSFQVMPYYDEDLDQFQDKIDKIDADLNSHEFRAVIPAIVDVINDDTTTPTTSMFERCRNRWKYYTTGRHRFLVYTAGFVLSAGVIILVLMVTNVLRHRMKHSKLSDSKSPIYDTPYQKTSADDELYQKLQGKDGSSYIPIPADDLGSTSDQRQLFHK